MPGFDFVRSVGRKIALQRFRRAVVLMVVDVADFDGSLPRGAIRCGGRAGGPAGFSSSWAGAHAPSKDLV